MNRFALRKRGGQILSWTLGLLFFFFSLPWLGYEFRLHLFASFGLACLLVAGASAFRYFGFTSTLSDKAIENIKMSAVAVGITLALLYFTHWQFVRDRIGQVFIDGYSGDYYGDVDDYGRPYLNSDVYTAHWYARVGLWAFEWIYLLACIALPIILNAIFRGLEEKRRLQNFGAGCEAYRPSA